MSWCANGRFLARFCLLLAFVSGAVESDEARQDWHVLSHILYLQKESAIRNQIDSSMVRNVALARSEGRKVDEKGENLLRWFASVVSYQKMIDQFSCLEDEITASGKTSITIDEFDNYSNASNACGEKRQGYSTELYRFQTTYSTELTSPRLMTEMMRCKMKTRLLDLESRYPPYPFMQDREVPLAAYDSKALLEYIKSRL